MTTSMIPIAIAVSSVKYHGGSGSILCSKYLCSESEVQDVLKASPKQSPMRTASKLCKAAFTFITDYSLCEFWNAGVYGS